MTTRIVTGEVRLSYANVWEPRSINGSDPKYSVSILIPKTDTATIKQVEDAVEHAIQDGIGKFGGKIPPRGSLKLPLRDGDLERDSEEYAGHYFINANSKMQPQIVDQNVQPIIDESQVYSGCYGRVSVNFYAFNTNGNRGVAAGLGNIQKLRDGEALGGGVSAVADFGAPTGGAAEDFLA
ncbi:DUF2815 family protein [Corynebacterium amycolatum]|jgi:hypothetical protein|uniref:DUF2815 family protein n=1 Tax=Corynebacterium amycolatum TaxID=43765 RepID=UPI00234CE27F|nr:DUF2815 family protein [Corynebacterium amycolatum]MDC7116132.1 DUF2815 family protein [Corynebacterium amycolatum]